MRHTALPNTQHKVLLIASLVLLIAVAGCSTHHSAVKPSPNTPAVIYAIPQSKAFAVAREATLAGQRRCGVSDAVFYEVIPPDWVHVYVIPMAGTAANGQKVAGFRFEVWAAAACGRASIDTLQTALDATGTATTVTKFQVRPYDEERDH